PTCLWRISGRGRAPHLYPRRESEKAAASLLRPFQVLSCPTPLRLQELRELRAHRIDPKIPSESSTELRQAVQPCRRTKWRRQTRPWRSLSLGGIAASCMSST